MSSFALKNRFRKAYSEYYPLVFSTLFAKTRNQEDSEDICHEVFIKFLNHFESIENPRGWLMQAINFEITNYYKKKSTRKSDAIDIDDASGDPNLAFVNGARDIRIIIQETIENSDNFENEQEKMLFDLIAIHNFTYKEAGKYLNISKWQAEYKYKKTEVKILQYLKEKGIKEIEDLL